MEEGRKPIPASKGQRTTRVVLAAAGATLVAAVAAGAFFGQSVLAGPSQPPSSKGTDRPAREYQITAKVAPVEIVPGKRTEAWTYNGTVPGPELRVKQGELVRVAFRNELPEQTAIHWHGVNGVENSNDGVPGVTQNAVRPGETYIYEFAPPAAGTFWYHSHQNATEQVDLGLSGILIVEPADGTAAADRDVALLLDDFVLDGQGRIQQGEDPRHGEGMTMMMDAMNTTQDMTDAEFLGYTAFTVNGKTAAIAPAIEVEPGQTVRLRLVNAGYRYQTLHLHGHRYRLTALDAGTINEPELTDKAFTVMPGSRMEIEFTADNPGTWRLHAHPNPWDTGMMPMGGGTVPLAEALVRYKGSTAAPSPADAQAPQQVETLGLLAYGKPAAGLGLAAQTSFDRTYQLKIDMTMEMEGQAGGSGGNGGHAGMPGMGGAGGGNQMNMGSMDMEMGFTVNGKAFPKTDPLPVKAGEKVKVDIVNNSPVAHPMHLHGQPFQVLAVDGRVPTGDPLVVDEVDVRPGQRVTIGFIASNPGIWMLHCHILPHASGGLTVTIPYEGYRQPFRADTTPGFNIGE